MYIVTGAAGLIGFHIAKSLEKKGKEVILVDHKTNISNKNNLAYLKSRAIIKPQYLFKFIKSNQKKLSMSFTWVQLVQLQKRILSFCSKIIMSIQKNI